MARDSLDRGDNFRRPLDQRVARNLATFFAQFEANDLSSVGRPGKGVRDPRSLPPIDATERFLDRLKAERQGS